MSALPVTAELPGADEERAGPRSKILLVDDSPATLALLRNFLSAHGHEVITADDGHTALAAFRQHRPDLVLMDVVMPTLDGNATTGRMRQCSAGEWVPIILMSALGSERDVIQGLESGADDYLPKPVNLSVLRAKIRSFERVLRLQAELKQKTSVLQRLQEEQAYEHELAASLIENIVHRESLRDPALSWHVVPSAKFSGDVVAAARAPDRTLYAMLGDATGHGLAASVSLIPALQVFYGMVRKGLPLATLVREINLRLREQLPVGRYFACAIVAIRNEERVLRYWNGGLPPGLLLDRSGRVRARIESRHVALGISADADFDDSVSELSWQPGDGVVLYSDGLVEAEGTNGAHYGAGRLEQSLAACPAGRRVSVVIEDLRRHLGASATHDDASILAIDLP